MTTLLHAIGRAAAVLGLLSTVGVHAACEGPEHRQFDFWLGEWQVLTPDGRQAGTNHIVREYGGCVLHERYTTPRTYQGESLSAYDAGRRRWHQTWVDNGGLVLLLDGQLTEGRMVLQGETVDPQGKTTRHRVTWTPNADGTVRQLWEQAVDPGAWGVAFDGLYRRR